MYQPSSSSSSPQKPTVQPGLTRYCSAPGAFLSRAVDSVIGNNSNNNRDHHQFSAALGSSSSPSTATSSQQQQQQQQLVGHPYFSADSSSITSEATCKVNSSGDPQPSRGGAGGLQRSYGLNEIAHNAGSLIRQRSSPAGFLNHLTAENGFSITRGTQSYDSQQNGGGHMVSRLKSQLSFTRQDSLSQIAEEVTDNVVEGVSPSSINGRQSSTPNFPTVSFGTDSWDSTTTSITFSGAPGRRARNNMDGDFFNTFHDLETEASLEMAAMDKYLHIPEDSIACRPRAKRGCATHPRSIAERERRTRISGKLKKLQEIVPNMDKQTSYADMLELAVQHIKLLQNEVQRIQKEMENCNCGSNQTT